MTGRSQSGPFFEISSFGEDGWIAVFSKPESEIETALFANAVAKSLRNQPSASDVFIDIVAGIDSVTLRFNPAKISADTAQALFANIIDATPTEQASRAAKPMEIPVCYGGEHGPDFDDLCISLDLTPQRLVDAHTAPTYRVLTLGFAPGFAYLGPLDPALHAPRLATPRQHVPAGAVGVAGPFTGVYPLASPGGWRILGRTPACLFDPNSSSPFLFKAGAAVRFVAISETEFLAQQKALS